MHCFALADRLTMQLVKVMSFADARFFQKWRSNVLDVCWESLFMGMLTQDAVRASGHTNRFLTGVQGDRCRLPTVPRYVMPSVIVRYFSIESLLIRRI